jgi:dimeric dUTPase (all-alpha-NTP-PPase superfamily)
MDLTQKFQQIVNLQNEFNNVINPEWRNAEYDFDTAIWVEAVELIDSFHWAWWKDGVDNLANAKVEVVDILHFLLSEWMIENQPNLASNLADSSNRAAWGRWASYRGKGKKYYIYSVKYFLKNHSRLYGVDSIDGFITSLATPLFASPEELINMYLAKNILNKIRQEFGYKLGTYIKMWGDVEDNVIVMQLAEANPEVTFLELLELVRSYYLEKVANVRI